MKIVIELNQIKLDRIMKIKTLLLFILISANAFSQIAEVSPSDSPVIIGEVDIFGASGINGSAVLQEMGIIDGKQYYYLGFQNQEYKTITDITSVSFHATKDELDTLFEMLKSVFKSGQEKVINLGDSKITLSLLSKNLLWFYTSDGHFNCTPAGLHKLFGKQWDKKAWKAYLKS